MSNILGPQTIKHYDDLMDLIGIWVVYTRSDKRFKCRTCWNYFTNDAAVSCSDCFGIGYKTTLERWKVYYTNRVSRNASISVPLTRDGFSAEHMAYIFTRTDMVPEVQDRVFVVEWDVQKDNIPTYKGRPKRLVQALRVLFIEPFFIGQQIYLLNHCGIVQESIHQYEPILMRKDIPNTLPNDLSHLNLTKKP